MAMALPIPELAPVTMAFWPFRGELFVILVSDQVDGWCAEPTGRYAPGRPAYAHGPVASLGAGGSRRVSVKLPTLGPALLATVPASVRPARRPSNTSAASSRCTSSEVRRTPSSMMPGWLSSDIQLPLYEPSLRSIMTESGLCHPSRSMTPTRPGRGSCDWTERVPAHAASASASTTIAFFIGMLLVPAGQRRPLRAG